MAGGVIYHWRHGWIPRTPAAALQKAKGSRKGADKLMSKHGIEGEPPGGTGGSKYSNMTISELVQRQNAGDRGAGEALAKGDYKKPTPAPAPAATPVSDKPGAPGVMSKAAYDNFTAKTAARRREIQPKADAVAKTLPEALTRELAVKYAAIEKRLSVGIGEYQSRPYPSEQDIQTLAHASASARALRERVAYFDNNRRLAAGKKPASAAQVALIQRLRINRKRSGEGGGFMSYTGDPAKLTKAEASALIDSLRGTY